MANAASSLLARHVNRTGRIRPLEVTTVSMGFGARALLAAALLIEGIPRLSGTQSLLIGWLALANTAFAFTLWNRTLQVLTAAGTYLVASCQGIPERRRNTVRA